MSSSSVNRVSNTGSAVPSAVTAPGRIPDSRFDAEVAAVQDVSMTPYVGSWRDAAYYDDRRPQNDNNPKRRKQEAARDQFTSLMNRYVSTFKASEVLFDLLTPKLYPFDVVRGTGIYESNMRYVANGGRRDTGTSVSFFS